MKREIKFRIWHSGIHEMLYEFALPSSQNINKGLNAIMSPIMQFTGLQDKNGVDIYEGDILKRFISAYEINVMSEVIYNDKTAMFTVKNQDYKYADQVLSDYEWEVIGNIHQNPELL